MTLRRAFPMLILATISIIIAVSYTANAEDKKDSRKEQRLSKNDLPAAILAAFQKQYPNAKIKEVDKEIEDSTICFEIESRDSTTRRNIIYAIDGRVIEIEEAIIAKQLPGSARAAIAKNYLKGKVEVAEKVIKDDKTTFEVKIESGRENFEAVFDSTGKLINSEKVSDEKDSD
jgi:hypothetical protein